MLNVRAVYEQGTSVTSMATFGGGVAVDESGDAVPAFAQLTSTVSTSTVLAQKLAPPEQPTLPAPLWSRLFDFTLLASVLPIGLWLVLGLAGESGPWGWITIVWLALIGALSIPVIKHRLRLKEEHASSIQRWTARVLRWQELRYCSSCDRCVDVKSGRHVPADQIQRLV